MAVETISLEADAAEYSRRDVTRDIARMSEEIRELAHKRNAVILAHNYQVPEVQDVADYVGDSLGLSRQAAATRSSPAGPHACCACSSASRASSPSPARWPWNSRWRAGWACASAACENSM